MNDYLSMVLAIVSVIPAAGIFIGLMFALGYVWFEYDYWWTRTLAILVFAASIIFGVPAYAIWMDSWFPL